MTVMITGRNGRRNRLMITDACINLIYNIFMALLGSYEPLTFNFDSSVYGTISNFLAFIFYILPIDGLVPIVVIVIGITVFRIVISVIKTVWDLLPIL